MTRRQSRSTLFPYTTLFRSKASLAHLGRLRPYSEERFLFLDEVTRRSLELTRTLRDNGRAGSLLSVLDRDRKSTRLNSSHANLVCRLLLEKKKYNPSQSQTK